MALIAGIEFLQGDPFAIEKPYIPMMIFCLGNQRTRGIINSLNVVLAVQLVRFDVLEWRLKKIFLCYPEWFHIHYNLQTLAHLYRY